jgi:GT2 family glycosyltransferase
MPSKCSIIISARELFSPTGPMLTNLRTHIPDDVLILVVIGGAPKRLREEWTQLHGDRVQFVFEDRFLNMAESRNIGLRRINTPLAIVMDNDDFVRAGWFEALIKCQRETGAMLTVPLILERPRRIHCAGCDLYVTSEEGKLYGHKLLRYNGLPYAESANIPRREIDYGEHHCMLVEVAPTLEHGAFDERLIELGDVDSGLVWRRRAGGTLWCEPSSVVHFVDDAPIRSEDIRFFAWRWDMRRVLDAFRYFESKWGFDVSEHGEFRRWLFRRNTRLGLLPRTVPAEISLRVSMTLDRYAGKVRSLVGLPSEVWNQVKGRMYGYPAWPTLETSLRNQRSSGHPDLK